MAAKVSFQKILIFILAIGCGSVFAQGKNSKRIHLTSLEGKPATLTINLDYVNNKLLISADDNANTLCFEGFKGLAADINTINDKFMQIQYETGGGTGVFVQNTVLICISDKKLYNAFATTSLVDSKVEKNDRTNHKTRYGREIYGVTLTKLIFKKSFHLYGNEVHTVKYESSKQVGTKYPFVLSFNSAEKVFYNDVDTLKGSYTGINNNGNEIFEKNFGVEKFPIVHLREQDYYFIANKWYSQGISRHLIEVSGNCN